MMSQQRRTFIACVFSFLFLTLSFRVESQYLLADFRDDKQELVLNETHFKKEGLCEKPLLYTIVGGSYGSRKSALLNSLGRLLKVPNSEFKSEFDDAISTGGINASDSNDWGLIFLDLMVLKDDPTGAKATNLESDKVDRMLSLLVAPLTNIVIYSIRDDDLKWLKMFSQFIETVSIPVYKRTPKPLLILTLHSNKHRIVNVDDMLENVIPLEIKSKFSDVKLVFMNEDEGEEEKKLLQENNFHPEKIPSYWSSMTTIGNIVKAHAETISNDGRWTGCEANEIMKKTLDQINQNQQIIDPLPIYKSLVSQRILKVVNSTRERLSKEVQEWITNGDEKIMDLFQTKFTEAKELIREQFIHYESEEGLEETVYTSFNIHFYPSLIKKVKDYVYSIEDQASRASRAAITEIEAVSKMNSLTGNPADINCKLRTAIQSIVAKYNEKMASIKASDSLKENSTKWLQNEINIIITNKHVENELIGKNRKDYLEKSYKNSYEFLEYHHKVCANDEKEIRINLAERLPAYFQPDVLPFLRNVEVQLVGTDCTGYAHSIGSNEVLVCQENAGCCGNGQTKFSKLYYNPSNTELRIRVKIANWEEKGCHNFIEFEGVKLKILQGSIVDEPPLDHPYNKDIGYCI
eukprot:CAMPEP_0173136738 /NCGR_PEP_ID=MMETSP1105-20130129/2660_1 /TAXON_ID=2985 /ORGANISM="Ochromonas sp., Strain BG-1" /LENGTH=633 /DNA_ID=CAMNT_0014048973 /DNA_START=104 /DNA_END=2005 /DNA_ORIENTATION=-